MSSHEREVPSQSQQLWMVRGLCRTVGTPIPEWAKDPEWLDGADFTALVLQHADAVRAILGASTPAHAKLVEAARAFLEATDHVNQLGGDPNSHIDAVTESWAKEDDARDALRTALAEVDRG